MNLETTILETIGEINEEKTREFKRQVREKINLIVVQQAIILAANKKIEETKEQMKKLEMELLTAKDIGY